MEPDYVYDDHPINENYWNWLDYIDIEEGDKIRIETTTTEWKNPMEITKVTHDELAFKTSRETEYMIVTYSKPHPLEPECPMVRTVDGFDSKGVIERIEVYKGEE